MGERARVEILSRILARASPDVLVGIGDDAAVLRCPDEGQLVWTTDSAIEGVHFRREWLSLADLGYRATMAAASDVAAMGARVIAALADVALPAGFTDAELAEVATGQREAMDELGAQLAGGNLAKGESLSIVTTVLGATDLPVLRSGARPGDALWLSGPVGLAAAGLVALSTGAVMPLGSPLEGCVRAWRRPRAYVEAGRGARGVARAMIDVSDGLATDLARILEASGVGAVLREQEICGPELEGAAGALGRAAIDLALAGGEDYVLLAAAPAGVALDGFSQIGAVTPNRSQLALVTRAGEERAIVAEGFDHFRSP